MRGIWRRLGTWGACVLVVLGGLPVRPAHAAESDSTLLIGRGAIGLVTGTAAPQAAQTDPVTGAATFRYPLELPPGTGGMQPELALEYQSQGRADAWVGYGWSLSLGGIRRSLRRGVPTYDDALDRFELDGEELVPDPEVAGRFHTRRQSFLRIDRLGDGSWEVRSTDGTVTRYGIDAQSRIERPAGGVFAWLTSERQDLRGNGLRVRYDRSDPGTAYPSEIRYTLRRLGAEWVSLAPGSPEGGDRVVHFVTEERPDPFQSQLAGLLVQQRRRLAHVRVEVAGALVRRYDLRFEPSPDSGRSLLAEIVESGSDAGRGARSRARLTRSTRFEYGSNARAGTQGWQEAGDWFVPEAIATADGRDGGVRIADVNGDGLPDFVVARASIRGDVASELTAESGVYLNLGTGFAREPAAEFGLPRGFPFAVPDERDGDRILDASVGTLLVDLDGDGRADLMRASQQLTASASASPGERLSRLSLAPSQHYAANRGTGWEVLASGEGGGTPFLGTALAASETLVTRRLVAGRPAVSGNLALAELNGDGNPDLIGAELLQDTEHLFPSGALPPGVPFPQAVTRFRLEKLFQAINRGEHRGFAELDPARAAFTICAGAEEERTDAPCDVNRYQSRKRLDFAELTGTGGGLPTRIPVEATGFGARFLDLDGDGLDDQVRSLESVAVSGSGRTVVRSAFLNDGSDFVRDDDWAVPPLLEQRAVARQARSGDLGVRIVDVNGDGRADLLQSAPDGGRHLWLSRGFPSGGGRYPAWSEQPGSSPLQVPAGLEFTDAQGLDRGVRAADLDGDGMVDFIMARGSERRVFLNRGSVPDLLTAIVRPLGARTAIEYAPSTQFDHTRADGLPGLPLVLQVVVATETDDGIHEPSHTSVTYEGGLYDAGERAFRGFERVVTREPLGRIRIQEIHQDPGRVGLVRRSGVRDAAGPLLEMRMEYTQDDVPGPPFVHLPASVETIEYAPGGGEGAVQRTLSTTRYERDAQGRIRFGRVAERSELGAVDESGRDLDASDTRTTQLEYAPANEALYLASLVSREVLRGGPVSGGEMLRESRFFYDGDSSGARPAEKGLRTREVAVLGEPGEPDPTITYAYDEYGNPIQVTDARANAGQGGGATRFEFDPTLHSFVVAVTNALGHTTRRSYEPGGACRGGPPFGSGLLYSERGPNLDAKTAASFCYDALGRPVLERAPGALRERTVEYGDAPGAASITETVGSGRLARRTVRELDGLGRVIRTRVDGPGGEEIVQWQRYDALGRTALRAGPGFASAGEPPADVLEYDALDRIVRIAQPGEGREQRFDYALGLVTESRPGGSRRRRLDPFGRVLQVEESANGERAVSRYVYRPSGELVLFADAEGNETRIAYDRLGRRRTIDDPDTGRTQIRYDAGGNVVSTRDAAGEIRSEYDALGRLTATRVNGELESRRSYDEGAYGIGRLSGVRDRSGALQVRAFDALGRAVDVVKSLDGAHASEHRFRSQFDALGGIRERVLPTGRRWVYERDARGYLTAVRDGDRALLSGIQVEADGRPRAWTAANGVRSSFAYEAGTGRLSQLEVAGEQALESRSFEYDAADRVRVIRDGIDAARSQRFDYDELDRLIRAEGPYAPGYVRQALHYRYGPTGNLLCLGATEPGSGCEGGRALAYPRGGPGVERPHAPVRVGGKSVAYGPGGELTAIGARRYEYNALGQLAAASESSRELAEFTYDATGRRAITVESPGADPIVRYALSPDFEWNATRGSATATLSVFDLPVVSILEPYAPGARAARLDARAMATSAWLGRLAALGLLLAAASALLGTVVRGSARGLSLPRAALAGAASWLLVVGIVPGAVWAAPLDGDLNGDGRLDMGDALVAMRIASGSLTPTAAQLESGDVAPLEVAPQAPHRIDAGDAMLLMRAASGDDVDGDGLTAAEEIAAGASPFREDTDRDGVSDAEEIAQGRDPARADGPRAGGSAALPRARAGAEAVEPSREPLDWGVRYYHPDALGSVVLVTDERGQPVSRAVYRPYGLPVDPEPGRSAELPGRAFTGQRFEAAIGLYDYGARFYDPALGRFLQPDTLVPDPADPQSFNRYAYVRGNPANRIDPTGNVDVAGLLSTAAGFAGSLANRVGSLLGSAGSLLGRAGRFGTTVLSGAVFGASRFLSNSLARGVDLAASAARGIARAGEVSAGLLLQGVSLAGRAALALADIQRRDLAATFIGFVGGNALDIVGRAGQVLAGALIGDLGLAGAGVTRLVQALLPRYDLYAGPGFGFEPLEPLTGIGKGARPHDAAYAKFEKQGTPFLSPERTGADLQLIKDVVLGDQGLGAVGQVYRVALVGIFGLKIAAQESLGALGR